MVPEMKAGLWMILQNIMERNYLAGYDIFMRLAIGAPSPDLGSVWVWSKPMPHQLRHVFTMAPWCPK